MFSEPKIAPSLLSADFMEMSRDVGMLADAGCEWMHVDVMDGHFVPNITMGVPFVKCLRAVTPLVIDAHLMVSNPSRQIPWFLEAGADFITVHIESYADLDSTADAVLSDIEAIRGGGARAGVSIKPSTPIEDIGPYVSAADMVLVMSVEPGFSGQGYIKGSEDRVAYVARRAKELGANPLIQVDGGIDPGTAPLVAREGADVFVSGNYVLKASDPAAAVDAIRNAASEAAGAGNRED